MNRILVLSQSKSDLVSVILKSCPNAQWITFSDCKKISLEQYDAACFLGGDLEKPLVLPAALRIQMEQMREAGKPIFCEFLHSVGSAYGDTPIETSHHRLIYSERYEAVEGLQHGDLLDGHRNEVIPYYFVPKDAPSILRYHDYICAHDRFEMDDEKFKKGKLALWKMDSNTLVSSFRLCNFKSARLAPKERWEKLIAYVVSFLAGERCDPVFGGDICRHNCGKEVLSSDDLSDTVRRGLDWFLRSDLLLDNGKDGVLEGYSHHILARNGQQLAANSVRTDCTGEVGGAFLLDYISTKREESLQIFKNTEAFCFDRMQVKSGEHKGMLRWTETAWETCYQDDVARAVIPTLLCENFGGGSSRFDDAVQALQYLVDTTGEDGLRVYRTDCSQLDKSRRAELKKAGVGTACAHYNSWYHAALLLAARAGAPEHFARVAKLGLSSIMALYPNTVRETSETEEMCRLIFPLALLLEHTKDPEHAKWLMQVTEDLERVEHSSGGYAEWDTGYRAACARNDKGECALLSNNGDPVADLLYSNNWLPIGFSYAYMVTGDEKFYRKWQNICTFLSNCQIHSEDPRLHGAWTRAMDMNRMEAYGIPHDVGWAPCCIESGWTVAEILMGMQFMKIAEKRRKTD